MEKRIQTHSFESFVVNRAVIVSDVCVRKIFNFVDPACKNPASEIAVRKKVDYGPKNFVFGGFRSV